MIRDGVYARAIATAGITNLVGTKFYPQQADQAAAAPYVIFLQISGPRHHDFAGATGLAEARFQFSAFAVTPEAAHEIAEQIRKGFDGFRGTLTDADATVVRGARVVNERDEFDDTVLLFRTDLDIMFYFGEATS